MFTNYAPPRNLKYLIGLVICLLLILSACSGTAPAPAPTQPPAPTTAPTQPPAPTTAPTAIPTAVPTLAPSPVPTSTTALPPEFAITVDATGIKIPQGIPAGLVKMSTVNTDTDWHTTVFRRLNDDVKLDDFEAAFKENPHSTLPMTFFIGGPDVPAGKTLAGYYNLTPGTYIVVDNWNDPWHYATFNVAGNVAQSPAPEAKISVQIKEYAFEMPKSVPAGKNLWKFNNQGKFPHNTNFIRLKTGKTIKDVIAFIKDQKGEPPADYFAAWNFMSPGVTSWGEIDLQPGDYLMIDSTPDFSSEGGLNLEKGMYVAFTVTP